MHECGFVLSTQVSAEAREHAQNSVCFRDAPEDGPGTSPGRKPSQGGACRAKMAHQVAWRLAAFHALPYLVQSSQGNSMVVGGRQGLASAPRLQLSVPHRYYCLTTRSGSPPDASWLQDGASGSVQGFHLQLHQGTARGEA